MMSRGPERSLRDQFAGTKASPRRQWEIINSLVQSGPLLPESPWYLLSARWLRKWQSYCQDLTGTVLPPGNVVTVDLLHPRANISEGDGPMLGWPVTRPDLRADVDYALVPEEAWKHLIEWYGLAVGSSAIPRPVVLAKDTIIDGDNGSSSSNHNNNNTSSNAEWDIEVALPTFYYRLEHAGPLRMAALPRHSTLFELRQLAGTLMRTLANGTISTNGIGKKGDDDGDDDDDEEEEDKVVDQDGGMDRRKKREQETRRVMLGERSTMHRIKGEKGEEDNRDGILQNGPVNKSKSENRTMQRIKSRERILTASKELIENDDHFLRSARGICTLTTSMNSAHEHLEHDHEISITSLDEDEGISSRPILVLARGDDQRTQRVLDERIDGSRTMEELGLFQPQNILIIYKDSPLFVKHGMDLFGPTKSMGVQKNSLTSTTTIAAAPPLPSPLHLDSTLGIVGLYNLGNTCFMNSALQCLSNCEPLTRYFLEGRHLSEINRRNPIGTGGLLAEAYGNLLRSLWHRPEQSGSSGPRVVDPHRFKAVLGRFESRFLGYHQQDAQELLSALLDRLHEDLNRVQEKPYIELQDSDGRPDPIVAAEAWHNHQVRNDSVVVDHFHGQYRSSVVCPVCGYNSVTFDPFLFLSLPLPSASLSSPFRLVLVREAQAMPMQVSVDRLNGTIQDLLEAVAEAAGEDPKMLIAAEIFNHELYKVLPSDYHLSRFNQHTDTINVYRLSDSDHSSPRHKQKEHFWVTFRLHSQSNSLVQYIGFPLLAGVSGEGEEGEEEQEKEQGQFKENNEEKAVIKSIQELLTRLVLLVVPNFDPIQLKWDELCTISKDRLLGTDCLFPGFVVELSSQYLRNALGIADPPQFMSTFEEEVAPPRRIPSEQRTTTLQQCIDLFTMEEQLSHDELWYCKQCRVHQAARKKLDIWRLPPVLVLHLKRFAYTRMWGEKIGTAVDFPLHNLDLSPRLPHATSTPPLYDLFGLSEHYGGLGGGHYTASARNFMTGRWNKFDDSHVSEIDPETLTSTASQRAAYLLFYIRREPAD